MRNADPRIVCAKIRRVKEIAVLCSTKLYSAALHKADEKYMDSDTLTFLDQTARQKKFCLPYLSRTPLFYYLYSCEF